MNYLQLVQRLRQECGVAGDGPTTTVGQIREMKRLCDWIVQSLVEIEQERTDWEWKRKPIAFDTTSGAAQYSPYPAGSTLAGNVSQWAPVAPVIINGTGITDFKSWKKDSFRLYMTSVGVGNEILLTNTDFTTFRNYYLLGTRQLTTARPTVFSVAPDRSLVLGLAPNEVYTVRGEYYNTAQVLTADDDIPVMPEDYHMVIVYKAMMKYGTFEAAQEVVQAGSDGFKLLMNRLKREQTPPYTIAGPLI